MVFDFGQFVIPNVRAFVQTGVVYDVDLQELVRRWRKLRRVLVAAEATRAAETRVRARATLANEFCAKDAKETVQEASDKCLREKRKTVNGDDLLWAMATLGFEDYIDPLRVYLTKYREIQGDTKGTAKGGEGSAKKDTGVHPQGSNAVTT
ncbi:hypothetical protein QQ045_014286 [Rhodiola kirilowii]